MRLYEVKIKIVIARNHNPVLDTFVTYIIRIIMMIECDRTVFDKNDTT